MNDTFLSFVCKDRIDDEFSSSLLYNKFRFQSTFLSFEVICCLKLSPQTKDAIAFLWWTFTRVDVRALINGLCRSWTPFSFVSYLRKHQRPSNGEVTPCSNGRAPKSLGLRNSTFIAVRSVAESRGSIDANERNIEVVKLFENHHYTRMNIKR